MIMDNYGSVWILILFQCLMICRVIANLPTPQTGRNVSCNNCDCSIFQAVSTCPIPRLTNRRDCPCCQTCLRQAGELCDEVAFPCDQEFGLYCNAKTDTCDGSYGLRASKVTHNSLLLIWHRPPEVQGHLYIFYTPSYTSDLRLWIMQETFTGADSAYIQTLNAATFYYTALVPEFQGIFYFENRSEILVKKTEGCLHKNQSYAVGETVADGCQYNCTCTPEGVLACIERHCPLMYKKGDIQDPLCKEHDDPASPDPCCVIYTCQNGHQSTWTSSSLQDRHCTHQGKVYDLATEFYADDCASICYCDEIGVVDCRPLKCPEPSVPLNHNGSCLEWDVKQHAVRHPPHCCPNYTCINDGRCDVNGTKYRHSETIPTSCDQHCMCDNGKVICESVCPEVSPNPPFDANCVHFIVTKDPSGCCMEWQCASPHSPEECVIGNVKYAMGEHWISQAHCRQENCTCRPNAEGIAQAECVGGCPSVDLAALQCERPVVVHSDDPCTCPAIHCADMRNDEQTSPEQEDPVYSLRAGLVNTTAAELILNVSSVLLSHTGAALETHIARVDNGDKSPRNVSDIWQISSTKLDQLQPTITEYITGFQSNSTYKIKARLILTDSASNTDIILPFTSTIFLDIPARGLTCMVGNVMYEEGAGIPQGCGQECVCRNGTPVCHAVQCTSQESVILASEFCPVPVLVKGQRDCCPRWECHPSATGCKVADIIYAHGEHWRNGCAEECHCRRGIITCRDMCQEQKRTLPHPSCQFVNITGSCCPVWNCHEGAAVPVLDFAHGLDNSMMNLTADSVTNTQARLTWQKPAELRSIFGFTVIVEEAVMDRESYREAKLIHPEIQEHVIRDLAPNTRYTATIKAMEDSDRVVASQSIQFQTLDASDVMLMLWLAYIGPDKAEAIWECQHCDEFKNLKLSLVSASNSEVAVGDVTPGLPKITLTSLHPKENYQLLLEGITVAGLSIKSNVVAFSTRSVADFNEIPKEFQNVTDSSSPVIFALDTQQQKLSTALITVSVLCTLFFVALLLATGLCCYYRRALIAQKANSYQTYTTDTMYR